MGDKTESFDNFMEQNINQSKFSFPRLSKIEETVETDDKLQADREFL